MKAKIENANDHNGDHDDRDYHHNRDDDDDDDTQGYGDESDPTH